MQARVTCISILSILLGAHVVRGQEVGDAQRGLDYAQRVCAACHAVLPSQNESPVPKATPWRVVANTPGMTGTALAVWFATPHPTMPNLIIAGKDRDDVIAYILSLREQK